MKILAATSVFLTLAASGAAAPDAVRLQAHSFATCAGRYSAVREHGWLVGQHHPGADHRYARFADLVEAVRDNSPNSGLSGPRLLNLRVAAKSAQARLLRLAAFEKDTRLAQRAAAMAERELRYCDALLLG